MGERWVSPPTYSINQPGKSATVEAKVEGVEASGKRVGIKPRWEPSNPEMVTVTPPEGSVVKIAVQSAGESRLRVTSDGVSRDLTVKAVQNDHAMQLEIIQVPPAGTPEAAERAKILGGHKETSYALGLDFGRKLKGQVAEVDAEVVARGLRDAFAAGSPLLTEGELTAALGALQGELRARQMKDQGEIAKKNQQQGEAFLAENKTKEGVVPLESGLQYKVLKAGDGPKPTVDDTVVCHYRGRLVDGTEFDSSFKRNKPATLPLKRLVKGWTEALQLMPVGSKWQLFVPANLAYGARGVGRTIGPNATLVFEVELLSIQEKRKVAAKHEAGIVRASSEQANLATSPVAGITVSFKLDARLSGPTYGGERWLSPPTFSSAAQPGKEGTVDVKVRGVDAGGRPVDIVPEWTAADPDMVTVTPGQNDMFKITVKRVGESRLRVASQGVSKELVVKLKDLGNAVQVEIVQESTKEPRPAGPAPDRGSTIAAPPPNPGGAAVPDASASRDEKARNRYALGMEMGSRLKSQFPEP
jgi:FKBP-type peptidyl-prolyl cis-trans isomerase FklB